MCQYVLSISVGYFAVFWTFNFWYLFFGRKKKKKKIFQIIWTIFMRWLNHYLLANFHKWWHLLEYGNMLSVKTLYCTSRKCVLHPSYQYIDNNQDQNIDYQCIANIKRINFSSYKPSRQNFTYPVHLWVHNLWGSKLSLCQNLRADKN